MGFLLELARRLQYGTGPRGGYAPLALAVVALACAYGAPTPWTEADPMRYRLTASGRGWQSSKGDRVLDDLRPRYAELFEIVLDAKSREDPDLKALRDDLERLPVDRRNYDALNAAAIAYFELNARAEKSRGGEHYLADSFRAAKVVAVPWRAYSEIEDGPLRDAILDFFEDVASGEKRGSRRTAARLSKLVDSFEKSETDAARLERIRAISARLASMR